MIRAPFTGVITAKRAFVGEAVSPFGSSPSGGGSGGAIATIVEFSSLYVGADVNEANLSKLAKNQPAEITLDAVPDKVYHGRLRQIVPAADRQKATVRVKVAFLDADDGVLPDLSARVAFTAEPTQGKETRARASSSRRRALTTVETERPASSASSRAARSSRPSTAGGDVQGQIEMTQGLQGGERLISLAGGSQLKDGERVRVEGQEELSMAEPLIRIDHVEKVYRRDQIEIPVLHGHQPRHPGGRVRRADGPLGLGQDDAAEPDRRHRPARRAARSSSAAATSRRWRSRSSPRWRSSTSASSSSSTT